MPSTESDHDGSIQVNMVCSGWAVALALLMVASHHESTGSRLNLSQLGAEPSILFPRQHNLRSSLCYSEGLLMLTRLTSKTVHTGNTVATDQSTTASGVSLFPGVTGHPSKDPARLDKKLT